MYNIIRTPDRCQVFAEKGVTDDIHVDTEVMGGELKVSVTALRNEPRFVVLRWVA